MPTALARSRHITSACAAAIKASDYPAAIREFDAALALEPAPPDEINVWAELGLLLSMDAGPDADAAVLHQTLPASVIPT